MLEYGLVAPPEGHRWMLKSGVCSEYRWLHLQKKVWWGWKKVHENMVSNYTANDLGYETAVRESADTILKEIKVNFKRPVGEVR